MKAALLSLSLLLSGCFYSLVGLDMSFEGRHKQWVVYQQSFVGQSIYRCLFAFCGKEKYPWDGMYLGEADLGNGVKERGFRYGRFDQNNPNRFPQCRYFFKYESATGLITGFHFEESEPFACRFSGA
jgi:hypothetical protein